MTLPIEQALLVGGGLLLLAVLASKLSDRLGVPGLLVFLGVGMLAGSDGPGGIYFDDARAAQSLGVVALAFILFAGGLETQLDAIRPVWRAGLSLSTLGVFLTAALVAAAAHWLVALPILPALLLGAIVSSTDAAAVFAVLRSRSVRLKGRLQPLLELESGSNDPMAVFLTLGLIELIREPATPPWLLLGQFLWQMSAGAALGWAGGRALTALINRLRLDTEGLYPVFTISGVLLIYSATALAGGNGFLAVYLAAIVIGNSDLVHKRSLARFHDGLAWLMQIAMFLTLGLLVFPRQLPAVALPALLLSGVLMFVARPVSVLVALAGSRLQFRKKLLIGWVGLRGAVPIILATFPLLAGLPRAGELFNLVFFIVLTSALLQGTTISWAARRLGLEAPASPRKQYPFEIVPVAKSRSELVEILIPQGSPAAGNAILRLGLPRSALLILIGRGNDYLSPRGATILQAGDSILALVDREEAATLRRCLGAREEPPEL